MHYNIKSTKEGRAKTLLFLCINKDKSITKIDLKVDLQMKHLFILLNLVNDQLLASDSLGSDKIALSDTVYAKRKKVRTVEQNETLGYNSNLWRQLYKKYRPNSTKIEFRPAEVKMMSFEKWNPVELQAFFDSDYFLFKIKSIRVFTSKISELRDWMLAKEQGEEIKTAHPNTWDSKHYKTLKTGKEITEYRQHLINLGFTPVKSDRGTLIGYEKKL
ncbi:hypothetical protein WAF17_21030 [Bernardetia sp. ABR2-2B]|uniref:hypothetical protein n=1 Tax=Bernardetia sp. ABR2-2B TaxID=3127472 RepID=UPI0030D0A1F6